MLAIAFRFPAGRYHATPWGRHVNEAEVEWPPSPWRILRALIATWHRKADPAKYPHDHLERLVETLASGLPAYWLPSATLAHTRHYMPQGRLKGGREDTSLIFDAFVHLGTDAEVVASWPNLALDESLRGLLDRLLGDTGFLGRAESWVEATLLDGWDGEPNCRPSDAQVDLETGEDLEPMSLLAPLGPQDYAEWRTDALNRHGLDNQRLKTRQRRLLATLPERLIDALRLETADIQQVGWSSPPGARAVLYQRPAGCLSLPPARRPRRQRGRTVTAARLALTGRPLPRIEDAVRIGELVRRTAIRRAEDIADTVPSVLSGHGLPAGNRHGHAFYLPEDADGDGHIDHVLVYAQDGLPDEAVQALDAIRRLWAGERGEWPVLFEGHGQPEDLSASAYLGHSRQWLSVTPYLHPWHAKKRFGIADQVLRECRERGLPEPEVAIEPTLPAARGGRARRPVHFHRFRSRPGLTQPDTRGCFLRLRFPEPIPGPLALGFACHYGLGIFMPVKPRDTARERAPESVPASGESR